MKRRRLEYFPATFPVDIWSCICEWLSFPDLAHIRQTCKCLREVVTSKPAWSIYDMILSLDYIQVKKLIAYIWLELPPVTLSSELNLSLLPLQQHFKINTELYKRGKELHTRIYLFDHTRFYHIPFYHILNKNKEKVIDLLDIIHNLPLPNKHFLCRVLSAPKAHDEIENLIRKRLGIQLKSLFPDIYLASKRIFGSNGYCVSKKIGDLEYEFELGFIQERVRIPPLEEKEKDLYYKIKMVIRGKHTLYDIHINTLFRISYQYNTIKSKIKGEMNTGRYQELLETALAIIEQVTLPGTRNWLEFVSPLSIELRRILANIYVTIPFLSPILNN